jgi:uncharacterized protein YPO0396
VFIAGVDTAEGELTDRRDEVKDKQRPLLDRRRDVREERASFAGRAGRVPRELDDMRQQVMAATGMTRDDLPFVAELIDVDPEHTRWRTALESVLGGSARLMLLPLDRLKEFSAAIDSPHHSPTFSCTPAEPSRHTPPHTA